MIFLLNYIINLEAFNEVLLNMYSKDYETMKNIEISLRALLKENHHVLKKGEHISKEEIKIELMQKKLKLQAYASQYLRLSDKI